MGQMSEAPTDDACTRMMFRLKASLDQRPLAIDLVSTLVGHVRSADRAFRHEMVTAFGEAFNNIVIHGYRDRSDGTLEVEAELRADAMTLRLFDTGNAVDFAGVQPPDLESMPEGGMGVFMIHALVDEVVYRGGDPNVLSLTKRTSGTSQENQARDELHPHG
jgi:anti-sigma regulatory factor (Ser/Thr protein kinase)